MIHESYPWKQELKRHIKQIRKYNSADRFDLRFDSTYTILEKSIMYSAFAARKLIECNKLSDSSDSYSMQINAYRPLKKVDVMHRWPENNTHDWYNPIRVTAFGKNICNWIIHSYIFCLIFDENGSVEGIYLSSDFDKNKYLYEILLDRWLDYLTFVSDDSIVDLVLHYDSEKSDYLFARKERGKL